MTEISRTLRSAVVSRAANRCEYCGLAQIGQEATFHIDHVKPIADGGETVLDNLALACVSCSLRKGARTHVADPTGGAVVPLYSPRRDDWDAHFRWKGTEIVPLTDTGQATVAALEMNRPVILAIRSEEAERGRHPPPVTGS